MSKTTLCHYIADMPQRGDNVAVKFKKDHAWTSLTWSEYYSCIESLALALKDMGLQPGDHVGIYSATRVEWSITDLAVLGLQGVTVSIYPSITADDLEFMLNKGEVKYLILENKKLLKNFALVKARCPLIKEVLCLEPVGDNADVLDWWSLLERGRALKATEKDFFYDSCLKAGLDDNVSIVFTSGTSGEPKGVLLTHRQVISEVVDDFSFLGVTAKDVSLSFLPYAHVLGRVEHWGHVYQGFTMGFAESVERVRDNMADIQPTFLIAVPRIFEKFYGIIVSKLDANPMTSELSKWALDIGKQVGELKMAREPVPFVLAAQFEVAKRLVLNKVREAFGGKLRFAVSGGAPLAADIALFFHACGILILEGYGLTESTAAIFANVPYDYKFGTVGRPVGDVQVRFGNDGEILVKSDKIMKEYYKDPESTAKAVVDGWFHTGDIGELLPSGQLRITDRKKDLIKTAGGKYVAPQRIENLLKLHPFISHVLVHGDQKKYIVALITLDKAYLNRYAKDQNIAYSNFSDLTQNSSVLEMARKAVAETNSQLASFESVKRFSVLPTEFTVESGELTPSLKVKRKVLDSKYRDQIDALYS